jgi:hypothetical protein
MAVSASEASSLSAYAAAGTTPAKDLADARAVVNPAGLDPAYAGKGEGGGSRSAGDVREGRSPSSVIGGLTALRHAGWRVCVHPFPADVGSNATGVMAKLWRICYNVYVGGGLYGIAGRD